MFNNTFLTALRNLQDLTRMQNNASTAYDLIKDHLKNAQPYNDLLEIKEFINYNVTQSSQLVELSKIITSNLGLTNLHTTIAEMLTKPIYSGSIRANLITLHNQHFALSASISSMFLASRLSAPIVQISELHQALTKITTALAKSSAVEGEEESLEVFNDISHQTLLVSEKISSQSPVNQADLENLNQSIQKIIVKEISISGKNDNSIRATIMLWLSVIIMIWDIFSAIKTGLSEKAATQQQIEALNQELKEIKTTLLDEMRKSEQRQRHLRLVNRECKLRLKAGRKSLIIGTLFENDEVMIIQRKGHWAQVELIQSDSTTVSGWVLKKYLSHN